MCCVCGRGEHRNGSLRPLRRRRLGVRPQQGKALGRTRDMQKEVLEIAKSWNRNQAMTKSPFEETLIEVWRQAIGESYPVRRTPKRGLRQVRTRKPNHGGRVLLVSLLADSAGYARDKLPSTGPSNILTPSATLPEAWRSVLRGPITPVVSFSHHNNVLCKRLVLDFTDRENHFLSRFENVTVPNVGRNEGNLGAVRTINNSKPLRVNFLHDSRHLIRSPRATVRRPHTHQALEDCNRSSGDFLITSTTIPTRCSKLNSFSTRLSPRCPGGNDGRPLLVHSPT